MNSRLIPRLLTQPLMAVKRRPMPPTRLIVVVSGDHPEQDEIVDSWISLEGAGACLDGTTLMGQLRHRDVPHLSAQGWRAGAKLRVERAQQGSSIQTSARDLKP